MKEIFLSVPVDLFAEVSRCTERAYYSILFAFFVTFGLVSDVKRGHDELATTIPNWLATASSLLGSANVCRRARGWHGGCDDIHRLSPVVGCRVDRKISRFFLVAPSAAGRERQPPPSASHNRRVTIANGPRRIRKSRLRRRRRRNKEGGAGGEKVARDSW